MTDLRSPSQRQTSSSGFDCRGLALLLVCLLAGGCQSGPRRAVAIPTTVPAGLNEPIGVEPLGAVACPPVGWQPDPMKMSDRHVHQVWVSPTGDTAYGIIRMKLPLPVGTSLVLWGFMNEMREAEGEGELLEKQEDNDLPGLRFVAEGGRYKIRVNLVTRGWTAWAVYAGTLRFTKVREDELQLAEMARETTVVGMPRRETRPAKSKVQTAGNQ